MSRKRAPDSMLPYGRQWINEDDIAAVTSVLQSDWLTTGPEVERFETALAARTGATHAVAVSSGTAALHCAVHAIGIRPGDEVIVPALTFAATANAVVYEGGTPVFADVDPWALLLDPVDTEKKIGPRTRAIITVDYAGQPCDYDALGRLAEEHGLALIADACHALGGADATGARIGSLAKLSCFSFHPVKHVTTGEGGAITTDDGRLAEALRQFRNHGIATDHRERERVGTWFYEMVELGYNYRLTDLQCALGRSQLNRLDSWIARRRTIAAAYDNALVDLPGITPLTRRPGVVHAYHLYVVRVDGDRERIFHALRALGIGVNVHYVPVHLHPFYRERFGTVPGQCPEAERAAEQVLSLPIFPQMSDGDVRDVVAALRRAVA